MLRAEQLSFARAGKQILQAIDCQILPGQVLGILGANGAGKSTLLALLCGELQPDQGQLTLNQHALNSLTQAQLAQLRAVLPQQTQLSFDLSVDEIIAMGAYPFPELSPQQLEPIKARALALADVTHLIGRRYPQLSGGEQQRVQFARVLLQTIIPRADQAARYLLLDEPTASLDPKHQHSLLAAARKLASDEAVGVVVVLHDVNLAAQWCTHLALLHQGRLIACGTPSEVLHAQALETTYSMPASVITHPHDAERRLVLFDAHEA